MGANSGSSTGYTISAVPEVFGAIGSRKFYSDQTMLIRQNNGQESATANSIQLR
jgi:hypothetical protein